MTAADGSISRRDLGMIVALAAAVAAVYLTSAPPRQEAGGQDGRSQWTFGVGSYGFVNYDDPEHVSRNPIVQMGLTTGSVKWAFDTQSMSHWQPLTWLSYMLDAELFSKGPGVLMPGAFHLVNVALHMASAILLYLVLKAMTRAEWASALVAALFAVHPLHVESVAWISERKDVLSALFWMLTLGAYVWYAQRPHLGRLALVVVCFLLGLMAKPMLVTLPFVLLLLDYWPLGRLRLGQNVPAEAAPEAPMFPAVSPARVLLEKVPLLVLAAAFSINTYMAQSQNGAMLFGSQFGLSQRLASAAVAYVTYLFKMVWPVNLAVLYPYDEALPTWKVVAALAGLALVTGLVIWQRRRRPYLAVGWFWYLGTLVPVIGIVQVGFQSMADRYTYVPLVGVFIMAAWGVAELAAALTPPGRRFVAGVGVAAVVTLALVAHAQVKFWSDSESLFRRALACTENNFVAMNNLAATLVDHHNFGEAMPLVRRAVEIKPDYGDAHSVLGVALVSTGSLEEGIEQFRLAIQCRPSVPTYHGNLAGALLARRQYDECIEECQTALRLSRDMVGVHSFWGAALIAQGKVEEGIEHYRYLVDSSPNQPSPLLNLGLALASQGRTSQALEAFHGVLKQWPDYVPAMNSIAWIYATDPDPAIRNGPEAVRLARQVVDITQHAAASALETLAAAYAQVGQFRDAVTLAEEAEKRAAVVGDQALLKDVRARLELFRAGQAFHTKPGK